MDRADGPPPGAPHAAGPHLPRAGATIYPQQAVYESPFVPGDLVGLPMGTVTGPHLVVMPFGQVSGLGPDQSYGPTRVVAASLAGPSGLVEVRSVDQSTVGPRGNLGAYLQGAILIPVTPLAPASTYRARVALLSRGMHPLDVSWTF
ncbi:MAG TPA: hypothetical protein VFX28_24835, partial [Methylomirabilota bacterium]|nr:hypothetical protein [Methylomirabilota bacterium]